MNKLSLEESLKILAPFHEEEKDIEPEENNKPVRKARRKIKTPSRSPVRIPKISPVRDYQEEKIETIESENSLYQEEKIEVKNKEKRCGSAYTHTFYDRKLRVHLLPNLTSYQLKI